ncbi:MAG: hypothetical protein JWQ90_3071 [Hydrocarboniphaga sp.]|uniref:DUF7065 domain-containing protein n=1 Tax=Hydrocarboniphaga sp. TaxID=2033016 RepID=UPI00262A48A2|nr:hypothetical protein [Hydrocarboniphaga sp.]MDB5970621.1 hypothetical protein [Hydrocarboniphaga sp.]
MQQSPSPDLSSGLEASREYALTGASGVERFAENFMIVTYDPKIDVGLWLHLGTWPDDFGIFEDQVIISLPGDEGQLSMYAYRRPAAEERPAGANLRLRCVEPFKTWTASFDGLVTHSSDQEMRSGRLRDGAKELARIELTATMQAPVWDAHQSASSRYGGGSMEEQVWASSHYQQLYTVEGTVTLRGKTQPFSGTGMRDHSRGRRGHGMDQWGGHVLATAWFPHSRRGFGLQRMWTPEGRVTLDTAFVTVDGQLHHAGIVEAPKLERLQNRGEQLTIKLQSDLGVHEFLCTTIRTHYTTPQKPLGMAFGADFDGPYGIYAPGHGHWLWDGDSAYGLIERSARLKPGSE